MIISNIIKYILIIILVILCYRLQKYCKELQEELLTLKKDNIKFRTTLSMIEYYTRSYNEGKNPYTMLRNITNTLQDENKE